MSPLILKPLLIPCINDDTFLVKYNFIESKNRKNFNQVYKPFVLRSKESEEGNGNEVKGELYLY